MLLKVLFKNSFKRLYICIEFHTLGCPYTLPVTNLRFVNQWWTLSIKIYIPVFIMIHSWKHDCYETHPSEACRDDQITNIPSRIQTLHHPVWTPSSGLSPTYILCRRATCLEQSAKWTKEDHRYQTFQNKIKDLPVYSGLPINIFIIINHALSYS